MVNAAILLKTDWKLTLGVVIPIIIWIIILLIVLWKLIKRYPLGKWSGAEPNPYQNETLAIPGGTIRGILTLTILFLVVILQIYAINNLASMEKISTMINAFELMLAFYFGSKVIHHLASEDKNKTKAVADAQVKADKNDFNDPEAIG